MVAGAEKVRAYSKLGIMHVLVDPAWLLSLALGFILLMAGMLAAAPE